MRPLRVSIVFALSLVVILAPVVAQQTATTPQTDPRAVASLRTAFTALGGQTPTAPASLVATGTYVRQPGGSNQSLPIKIEALGAESIRWDTNDSNGTVTLVVSRASSWMQSPDGGRALAVGETFGRGAEVFPILLLSRWLGTSGVGMTWVGVESSSGMTLNHMIVTPSTQITSGPRMANCEVWFEAQTNLPTRIRVSHGPTDSRVSIPLDLDFSDYRAVNGVLFPFSITVSMGTHITGQIQFQSITPNVPVSPNDFVASGL